MFQQLLCLFYDYDAKEPFIYYVSTCSGGGGQKFFIFAYYQY